MQKNPYLILGVSEDATFAELQEAYLKLQNKYKADRFLEGQAGADAIKNLQELDWAYEECKRLIQEKATIKGNGNPYEQISKLIKENKVNEAQSNLDAIEKRDAEWHYYQSIIFYKKNWLNDSRTQLEICVSLEPNNLKYSEALSRLKADMSSNPYQGTQNANQNQQAGQTQNRAGYTQPQYTNSQNNADACCNTCCTLMCCDSCCECCGGDLISCC